MKQKLYSIIALCLAVSTVAVAQEEATTLDDSVATTTISQELRQAPGFTVFARLVEACGLQAELSKVRDEEYEERYQTGRIENLPTHYTMQRPGIVPQHRKYGYTLFAETDATWESLLGKAAAGITVADIKTYLINQGLYASSRKDDNYTDPRNIVHQFITYHILPMRLSCDKLVNHYNERGYNYQISARPTIPVEEFYTTLGQPRLLKVYESSESKGVYLNRFPELRNGRGTQREEVNDYRESGTFKSIHGDALTPDENQGIFVVERDSLLVPKGHLSATNGIVYPISKLLAYTDNVQHQLASQRLRFDVTSLLPEMMNNDLRRPMQHNDYSACCAFPVSSTYPYFENLDISSGTRCYYLSGLGYNWYNYQGDEFNITGPFDFTLKMPPVPSDGEYELRIAISSNSYRRTIAQFSFGSDKEDLTATGLPIDMRIGGQYKRIPGGQVASPVGWEADTGDEAYDRLMDLRLHEQGYMKGPNYITVSNRPLRELEGGLRRVIWRGHLEAGKAYYLRVRNCLDDSTLEFYFDYIELCPRSVYDNPEVPEDIW